MKRLAVITVLILAALPAWAQSSSPGGGSGSTGGGPASSSRAAGPGTSPDAGPANRPETSPRAEGPGVAGDPSGAVEPEGTARGAGPGTAGETATGALARDPGLTTATPPRPSRTVPGRSPRAAGRAIPDTEEGMVPLGREGVPQVAPRPGPTGDGEGPTGRPLDLPRTGR